MTDLILVVDHEHDVTYVGVADIHGDDPKPVSMHDMVVGIMQWLREVDITTRMNVISAIVLEHQVSAHINTATEEERLASANLGQDDAVLQLVIAVANAAYRPEQFPDKGLYVEVGDVYKELEKVHFALPNHVVYTYLKTLEHHTGRVIDLGEGFFKIAQAPTKHVPIEKRFAFDVNKIKAMIDTLSEEERDEIQSHVTTSLHGTQYEI